MRDSDREEQMMSRSLSGDVFITVLLIDAIELSVLMVDIFNALPILCMYTIINLEQTGKRVCGSGRKRTLG